MTEPINDVVPTMNNEYAVAVTGLIPNKYTRMGTERIDPPLPINPKIRPTKKAPKNPNNSNVSNENI